MSINNPCSFVSAALPSLRTHIHHAMIDNPDHFTNESINAFFKDNVNKFLTSIGVVIKKLPPNPESRKEIINKGRMNYSLVSKYKARYLDRFRDAKFLDGCEMIIDSAGYSVQQPDFFDLSEIKPFIDVYHNDFLLKEYDRFSYAFMLDIAPGSFHCPFTSYENMNELADYSYNMSYQLPEYVRNKMLFVKHFRTPSINAIYDKLLKKYGDGFNNFATGGLVSFSRSKNVPPQNMYAVPLIQILDHALKVGLKKFRFHVLGGSEWKEIIGHKFFEKHVKEVFDIDMEITYDSSTIFQTLCMGRYTFFPDHESKSIRKLSLRGDKLESNSENSDRKKEVIQNNYDTFCRLINDSVCKYGMKGMTAGEDPIYVSYDNETDKLFSGNFSGDISHGHSKLSRLVYAYGMFQILHLFKVVDEWCKEWVEELYPLYKAGDVNEFNKNIDRIIILLNGGKIINKNMNTKAKSIHNSLKLIDEFKENKKDALKYCEYLINEYMIQDECEQLKPSISKSMQFE